MFVRTWIRNSLKVVSDVETEVFKEWEKSLLQEASFYDGVVAGPAAAAVPPKIFEDRIEDWELNAADGSGPGPAIPLGQVKRNHSAKFRLQEKYKGLFFVDKDPNGDVGYYENGDVPAPPKETWEYHKILGLIWQNNAGWRLETKLCSDLTGTSQSYLVNACLPRMIKECNRNRGITFRSDL